MHNLNRRFSPESRSKHMKVPKSLIGPLCLFALGNGSLDAFAQTRYSFTDLVTLGGADSYAFGINNHGEIVGVSQTSSFPFHAFLYSSGRVIDLGTLPDGSYSTATAINAKGQIVGYSLTSGPGYGHAFLYDAGSMFDLGTLGGDSSWAGAINDQSQVAGSADTSSGATHAVLFSSGTLIDLGILPGGTNSSAATINEIGEMAGEADTSSGATHAVLYSLGKIID